ncbi:hypothetical protein VNO77_12935 [Canavalia gladiata]|uniref:Uncharacterized protein n=1 Tax=Canavalia gladiata TaxID=3824 RepID=A0AAN9LWT7_CANGL
MFLLFGGVGFTFLSSNYVVFWGWCTYRRMPFFLGHLGYKVCNCANGWDDLISIILYVFNSFRSCFTYLSSACLHL